LLVLVDRVESSIFPDRWCINQLLAKKESYSGAENDDCSEKGTRPGFVERRGGNGLSVG
jgi:hypothetical protein